MTEGDVKPTPEDLEKAYESHVEDLLRTHDPVVHVFVIDDQVRFALQVHRYLSGSTVFGIGGVSNLDNEFIYTSSKDKEFKRPKPLISEHGFVAIWWLPAKGNIWRQIFEVKALKNHAQEKEILVLIDVFGQKGRKGERFPGEQMVRAKNPGNGDKEKSQIKVALEVYECKEVAMAFLENMKGKSDRLETHFVSSYVPASGGKVPKGVIHKSPEELRKIRESLSKRIQEILHPATKEKPGTAANNAGKADKKATAQGDSETYHVLVTGHGFEMQNGETSFGLPSTVELLNQLGAPFRFERENDNEIRLETSKDGFFPVPVSGIWAKGYINQDEIAKFCRNMDLDGFWDYLLETELVSRVSKSPAPTRLAKKIAANKEEYKMRNAFRRVILKYDWGHLNQYLWGVRLPWKCWLTTNYTRFADRAVEMVARQSDGAAHGQIDLEGPLGWRKPADEKDDGSEKKQKKDVQSWRIVGTAKDAAMLMKEELHNPKSGLDGDAHLFKLHGDIGQLHTMAIAGHDKEMYSLLSLPIDYLHDLYVAARTHLFAKLENAKARKQMVVWHVVGHGLYDPLLIDLIKRVVAHPRELRSAFLVANPKPQGPCSKLLNLFKGNDNVSVYAIPLKASQYMARVFYHGLPGEKQSLEEWLESSKVPAERAALPPENQLPPAG